MYKNKNLNRSKIIDTIKRFCNLRYESYTVPDDFDKLDATRRRIKIRVDSEEFFIDFHFRGDGTTTIQPTGGDQKYSNLKVEIADFIINSPECVIGDANENSKHYIVPNIEVNDFRPIVDILRENEYCNELVSSQINSTSEMYKFKGSYNESLSVFYYPTKNKVMIQGKPLLLFYETLACFTELIDLDEIPQVYKDTYNIEIDKSDIENQYQLYLPNSHDKHSPNLKKFLCQSIYNLSIDGDMFDYTFLAFPVLKALEGHLRTTLYTYRIECDRNGHFVMFKPDASPGKYCLDTQYHSVIGNPNKVRHFEDAYSLYHNQRHGLFHWGNPALPGNQTRTMGNIGNAKSLIIDTLKLIDSYYML